MAGVTLLALGNGAPDVFASLSAVRSGQYRTGFGAILSAGAFVSAFVVGFVAIYSAPFPVDPAPFVRGVLFYMTAALFLFCVYLSGEIFVWQAVGFVAFYVFFVALVFWMDLGIGGEKGKLENNRYLAVESDSEIGRGEVVETVKERPALGFKEFIGRYQECSVALEFSLTLVFIMHTDIEILAWGNSVGDLVADIDVAKAGQPGMAMAGCFACPMFNMLVGLGTALMVQTANIYPQAYELHFHIGIVIAFVFLMLSLMGSLLVIIGPDSGVPGGIIYGILTNLSSRLIPRTQEASDASCWLS
ncbi:cation/calcium exchanger 5 [Tripterygium wilfordii]|uniref:Cation/calcium exchanger 5 n=1 Tax=Tripterygium wilfordii TaxID=458696 RepID=A0A7J7CZM6_TRIWF|nr:cation/calcium exchanger 5 [Tripterygium wilfordii]